MSEMGPNQTATVGPDQTDRIIEPAVSGAVQCKRTVPAGCLIDPREWYQFRGLCTFSIPSRRTVKVLSPQTEQVPLFKYGEPAMGSVPLPGHCGCQRCSSRRNRLGISMRLLRRARDRCVASSIEPGFDICTAVSNVSTHSETVRSLVSVTPAAQRRLGNRQVRSNLCRIEKIVTSWTGSCPRLGHRWLRD